MSWHAVLTTFIPVHSSDQRYYAVSYHVHHGRLDERDSDAGG